MTNLVQLVQSAWQRRAIRRAPTSPRSGQFTATATLAVVVALASPAAPATATSTARSDQPIVGESSAIISESAASDRDAAREAVANRQAAGAPGRQVAVARQDAPAVEQDDSPSAGGGNAGSASSRPNLVVLLTDDQRWNTLGVMGNAIIQTPQIDRLAREGVVFDNCFVTTSICMTSRASIFLGQYAARHGIWDFRTSLAPEQLERSYPGRLKRAGYYVGFIGKWGVGNPPKDFFDYDRGWPGQNVYFPKSEGGQTHLTTLMDRQAMEFFDTLPTDRPFCLSISFKAPHCQDGHPKQFLPEPDLEPLYRDVTIPPPPLADPAFFAALPEWLRKSENRARWEIRFSTPELYQEMVKNYYRLITGVDRVVGHVREKLAEKGLADNTVILFTSDNGFYLGDRGLAGKWLAHDVSMRVPLLVYDPRLPESCRGRRRDELVLNIDVAPTLLALAGVPIPDEMQGESLRWLIEGYRMPWRTEFFYEHRFRHSAIPPSEAVRDGRHKYIRYIESSPLYEELYDLATDPDEAHNLADQAEHAALLDSMRAKWSDWRRRAAGPREN